MKIKYYAILIPTFLAASCTTNASNIKINGGLGNTHIVSFDTNGGTFINSEVVKDGDFAKTPSIKPTKEHYDFLNWYSDPEHPESHFEFDTTAIKNDITLFANYRRLDDDFCNVLIKGDHCKIDGKDSVNDDYIKGSDVRYFVTPEHGYHLTKLADVQEEFNYEIKDNGNYAYLTIPNINKSIEVNIGVANNENAKITFNGNDTCLLDNKSSVSFEVPKGDEVNYRYNISPAPGFESLTEDSIQISGSGDFSYEFKDTFLTISKINCDINISATASHNKVNVYGYSANAKFKIGTDTPSHEYIKKLDGTKGLDITVVEIDENYCQTIYGRDVALYVNGEPFYDYSVGKSNKIHIDPFYGNLFFYIKPEKTEPEVVTNHTITFKTDEKLNDLFKFYYDGHESLTNTIEVNDYSSESINYVPFIIKKNDSSADAYRIINKVVLDSGLEDQIVYQTKIGDTSDFLVVLNVKQDLTVCIKDENCAFDSFNNCNWRQIKSIIDAGDAERAFKVGDTKDIILNENGKAQPFAHKVRIIDFNHDILAENEEGKASVTFEFTNVLTLNDPDDAKWYEKLWHGYYIDGGHWGLDKFENCGIDKYLNNEFLNEMLPSELSDVLKMVKKNVDDDKYIDRKVFILNEKELTNESDVCDTSQAYVYKYYENLKEGTDSKLIKTHANNGKATSYYTSSATRGSASSSAEIKYINYIGKYTGTVNSHQENMGDEFAPAFCI